MTNTTKLRAGVQLKCADDSVKFLIDSGALTNSSALMREAADEIEALRQENAALQNDNLNLLGWMKTHPTGRDVFKGRIEDEGIE